MPNNPEDLAAIASLDEPARRALYEWMAGSVAVCHWRSGFHLDAWLLGPVGFPAVLMALQWSRARRDPSRLAALCTSGSRRQGAPSGAMRPRRRLASRVRWPPSISIVSCVTACSCPNTAG